MTTKTKKKTIKRTEVCPQCGGSGIIEYEHGLIRLHCRICKGTGKIERDNDNTDKGTRSAFPGSPGQSTGESTIPKESKTGS